MATEEYLIYWNSPSPSSNSMVVYYQGSGQSSIDNPLQNRQQRPANSGDQSDMATEEHFDVTSLLNLPQWSPPPSQCSSANSMVVYQKEGSGRSSMDFVDRPLYIAGDWALSRQKLLQFWMDASVEWGPRGGIMSINKENLPQSLECLGVSLLHLYVEDKFDTLLYWQGQHTWEQLYGYLNIALKRLFEGSIIGWTYTCDDLEQGYGQGMMGSERVTVGVWRIGPREWVAKIRYQQHSLELPFYVDKRGRDCYSDEDYQRTAQVVFEDARLDFPNLFQDFLCAVAAAQGKDQAEDAIDYLLKRNPVINGWLLNWHVFFSCRFLLTANPYEDFVNGEVEPVSIGSEGTEEAEIAESQLNPDEDFVNGEVEPVSIGSEGTEEAEIAESQLNPDEDFVNGEVEPVSIGSEGTGEAKIAESQLNPDEDFVNGEVEPVRIGSEGTEEAEIAESQLNPDEDFVNGEVELVSIGSEGTEEAEIAESQLNPDEDFVNGEVEPVRIGGEGTGEAEIAESQLNPGPSRKRRRKEKIPTGERGTKKTTRVKNVIPLDKILQVKEMCLKSAAELLRVSRYALKRACRNYGINRWPPRNEHKTSAVVDQEGIPEPSDQALMTTVDTNNVALKEILPQFLLENPDENSCNDEVEAVGMGGAETGESEVKKGELNCVSSDKGERNEKTPQGESANNKTTGVRIEIPLEEILKYKKMCRKEAATHLQVSISTLKRVCRGYQIYRWPPRDEHKLIGPSRPNESPAVVDQERNPQKNSTTLLPSNEESASMDTNSVTVKARYEGNTFKFQLSKKPWGMVELEEQVKKRLQLETQIKYKDEDGDLISIVCDDDLQQCILSSRSQGTTSIVLLLENKR